MHFGMFPLPPSLTQKWQSGGGFPDFNRANFTHNLVKWARTWADCRGKPADSRRQENKWKGKPDERRLHPFFRSISP